MNRQMNIIVSFFFSRVKKPLSITLANAGVSDQDVILIKKKLSPSIGKFIWIGFGLGVGIAMLPITSTLSLSVIPSMFLGYGVGGALVFSSIGFGAWIAGHKKEYFLWN